ncbi:MAG TPA: hypothetical protein VLE48_03850 [Terriglobales bacterium]|nr:hypothetical protein [Terriglobales bacterium]
MKRSILQASVVLALAGSAIGQDLGSPTAESTTQVTRDPQAVALLMQCAAVMGAANVLDTYAEGSVTRADGREPPGALIARSKGTDRMRVDFAAQDCQQTSSVSRGAGYDVRDGKRERAPLHSTRYQRPEHVPALACVIDVARPNIRIFYEGVEQDRTGTFYHVKFVAVPRSEKTRWVDEVTSEFHVFLDAQTLVVAKTRTFVFAPDAIENRSTWEVRYSDYRMVNGVLMPFRLERFDNDQKLDEVVFSNVRVNVGIADSDFQ